MAKSKLVARRVEKKATIIASMQTVRDAIRRATLLGEELMREDQNDPRINQLQGAVNHLSRIMRATPQELRAAGISSIEDYFDDAKQPAEALKIKNEVNMIAKMHDEARARRSQPAEVTPERAGVGYVPESAVAERGIHASDKEANANGGSWYTTDRDEKGEAKAPEKLEVPRVATKKVAQPKAEPAPAAPVTPTPAAPAAGTRSTRRHRRRSSAS
jgi:hypothetical protein